MHVWEASVPGKDEFGFDQLYIEGTFGLARRCSWEVFLGRDAGHPSGMLQAH